MLIEKLRFKKSVEDKEPKKRVAQFFTEYEDAYHKLHKPSDGHQKEYTTLYFVYQDYMQRRENESEIK